MALANVLTHHAEHDADSGVLKRYADAELGWRNFVVSVKKRFLPSKGSIAENFSRDTTYPVVKVVDGDTIKIEYEGRVESVRLIGVDTPETVHPTKPVEPYGPAASAFTTNLLAGESVYLRFGEERRDGYGRMLAYVFRASDCFFVNLELVCRGYGRITLFEHKYTERFQRCQDQAQEDRKGLWLQELGNAAASH
ncbi:MAG: thermonuclease family protein [Candidatus Poribacteria bacterium]|nr:thermonuclease family protein [Candidatus Poribacteria bacterium]MDE0506463.1 thermonuclease family protein [Candidatus Poribacteria bacterium]